MAVHSTTPAERLTRLLGEGASFVSSRRGEADVDVTHDVLALLERLKDDDYAEPSREIVPHEMGAVTVQGAC